MGYKVINVKPDFIHIGPGRSGTSFLYKVFQSHPGIGLAKNIKETNFFNFNYYKGIEWYLKFFDYNSGTVKGEISPNYFYDVKNLERINMHFPDVKIITILRNPYERMVSLYYYLIRSGKISKNVGIEKIYNKNSEYFSQNIYLNPVRKIFELFPKSQIHIDFYDSLKRDKTTFIKSILEFLCVDSDGWVFTEDKVNQSQVIKNIQLINWGRKVADYLRKHERYSFLEKLKGLHLLNGLLYKNEIVKPEKFSFPDKIIYRINSDIHSVENILNVDLSHWKK